MSFTEFIILAIRHNLPRNKNKDLKPASAERWLSAEGMSNTRQGTC
jgi:hypothetical protein